MVLPRWAGLLIGAVILILAATLLAPLLPGALGVFAYYVLLVLGVVIGAYGLYLLIVWLTARRGPRDPHVP